jgi:Fe-S-cluster containining protein
VSENDGGSSDPPKDVVDTKRPYGLRIIRNAMVPLVDDDGKPRHFGPYQPVVGACNTCPARCCRFTVKVSIPDAVRFCVTLGVPFFAGLRLVMSERDRSFKLNHDERIFKEVTAEHWTGAAEIALRRREDGGCAHLVDLGGFERCGVYSARPSTCRLYPIVWESDRAQGGPPLISCPVAYGVTAQMEETFYQDAAESIQRWQIHDDLLGVWHARSADEAQWDVLSFLHFAIPRAAEIMGVDGASILEAGGSFERLAQSMRISGTLT